MTIPASKVIKYWTGPQPGYLPEAAFHAEVASACAVWADAAGVSFTAVDTMAAADITFIFSSNIGVGFFTDGYGTSKACLLSAVCFGSRADI
jgi:hypothetical protein